MNGIGSFSPPAMITRTDDRSRASMPGWSSTARIIAGAIHTAVTFERSISSTTVAASNVRWMIVVAPTAIIVVVIRSSAPTWYSGPHASPTSARREPELGDVGEVLPRQVGVGEHHALRPPGRSRRVHQPVDVVAAHGRPLGHRLALEVAERVQPVDSDRRDDAHRRELGDRGPRVASSASSISASSHTSACASECSSR